MLPLGCFPLWGREGVILQTLTENKRIFKKKGFQQSLISFKINKISVSKIENKERVYTLSFREYLMTEEQDSHHAKAPFGSSIRFSP